MTLDYLDGSVWKAERVFGWSHHTVALGLIELRTGITCLGNFSARGNHKTEEKLPELEADILALGENPESQADSAYSVNAPVGSAGVTGGSPTVAASAVVSAGAPL